MRIKSFSFPPDSSFFFVLRLGPATKKIAVCSCWSDGFLEPSLFLFLCEVADPHPSFRL